MGMATDSGVAGGNPINDCFGSTTQAFGTPITRLIPPRSNKLARISSLVYVCGATAHTVTVMPTLSDTYATTDAAAGQAVVAFHEIPTAPDGSIMANTDFVVLTFEDGSTAIHKVSSISGLNVTMTANLAKKMLSGARIYFMGQPSDHPDRQFTAVASATLTLNDQQCGAGCATRLGEPIMIHSDNATAAGILQSTAYCYVSIA